MRGIGDLIRTARHLGVQMTVTEQERVMCSGPRLTPELARLVRSNREQIVAVLTLENRLQLGWMRCSHQRDPAARAELEEFWAQLLRDYQGAHDVELIQEGRDAA